VAATARLVTAAYSSSNPEEIAFAIRIMHMRPFTYLLLTWLLFCSTLLAARESLDSKQKSLVVNLEQFLTLDSLGQPLSLHLIGTKLDEEKTLEIAAAPAVPRIYKLLIQHTDVRYKHLHSLLEKILAKNLTEIEFIDVKIRGSKQYQPGFYWRGPKLSHLSIIGCDVPDELLEDITKRGLPSLTHLTLSNSELGFGQIRYVGRTGLPQQLKYLDLSGNDAGNELFNIFPPDSVGALETLLLNNLDFQGGVARKFFGKFNTDSQDHIKWPDFSKPFFQNLSQLEIVNSLTDSSKIFELYNQPAVQKLPIFLGPLPIIKRAVSDPKAVDDYGRSYTAESKEEQQVEYDYIKQIFELPLASKRTNIELHSIYLFKLFLETGMGKRIENIILSGSAWTNQAVRLALNNQELTSVKFVNLMSVNMSELEIERLIMDFPKYTFQVNMMIRSEEKIENLYETMLEVWPTVKVNNIVK